MTNLKEGWWSHVVNTGPEAKGEVVLSMAVGAITIEMASNQKAFNVKIKPENAQHPITGYIGVTSDLGKIVNESIEKNMPLLFRFEQQRKKDIDVSTPIMELKPDMATANKNTIKVLVGVYNFNSDSWILSNEASAKPENDPDDAKMFVKGRLGIDTSSLFEAPKEIVKTATYDKTKRLLEIYFFLKEQEIRLNIKLSNKDRMKLSTGIIKVIERTQMISTQSDGINYESETFSDSRDVVFNIIKLFAPIKEEYVNDSKQWLTQILTFSSETIKQFNSFVESSNG